MTSQETFRSKSEMFFQQEDLIYDKGSLCSFLVNKVIFIFSVTHQNMLSVSFRSNISVEYVSSIINICKADYIKYFKSCIACSLLLSCFCWCIAVFLGRFLHPVDQWDDVKPLAGLCITSTTCAQRRSTCKNKLLVVKNSTGNL